MVIRTVAPPYTIVKERTFGRRDAAELYGSHMVAPHLYWVIKEVACGS